MREHALQIRTLMVHCHSLAWLPNMTCAKVSPFWPAPSSDGCFAVITLRSYPVAGPMRQQPALSSPCSVCGCSAADAGVRLSRLACRLSSNHLPFVKDRPLGTSGPCTSRQPGRRAARCRQRAPPSNRSVHKAEYSCSAHALSTPISPRLAYDIIG